MSCKTISNNYRNFIEKLYSKWVALTRKRYLSKHLWIIQILAKIYDTPSNYAKNKLPQQTTGHEKADTVARPLADALLLGRHTEVGRSGSAGSNGWLGRRLGRRRGRGEPADGTAAAASSPGRPGRVCVRWSEQRGQATRRPHAPAEDQPVYPGWYCRRLVESCFFFLSCGAVE